MSMAMDDMVAGTVVDHAIKRTYTDDTPTKPGQRTKELRDPCRRGIIVKVLRKGKDSVQKLFVKFSQQEQPVEVPACELVRVFRHGHRTAKEAYRRLMQNAKVLGERKVVRERVPVPQVIDDLGATPDRTEGIVKDEFEDTEYAGMDLPDTEV